MPLMGVGNPCLVEKMALWKLSVAQPASPHLPQKPPKKSQTRAAAVVKKMFRTKFSEEQREKMVRFAEKVGWKMQEQEQEEALGATVLPTVIFIHNT
ncbi:hypothetical protein Sango_0689600 [Sesamum angolense]|uniref:Uncharacterized protein n=1 Tax=Sesamum angolense TaxID=2727404 RepID=A0AAE1X853_9LAMI|nr:hypothetical protein Sango_0689600 [Sesamum angolense]